MARLYLALCHHPVMNRRGEVIAAAVTNLDLHDIARAARTFGVRGFFVVTPLEDQQGFARRIVDHWTSGPGADHLPDRRQAMQLVRIMGSLSDAVAAVTAAERPGAWRRKSLPLQFTCSRRSPAPRDTIIFRCAALPRSSWTGSWVSANEWLPGSEYYIDDKHLFGILSKFAIAMKFGGDET
jgi:hypothetical protein